MTIANSAKLSRRMSRSGRNLGATQPRGLTQRRGGAMTLARSSPAMTSAQSVESEESEPRPGSALRHYAGKGDVRNMLLCLDEAAEAAEEGVNLIESRGATGRTALLKACVHGQPDTVRVLLQHGADPEARDDSGRTALLCVTQSDKCNVDTVEALLAHGVNINAQCKSKWTAINQCASENLLEVAEMLIEYGGCDLDLPNCNGWTPVLTALAAKHDTMANLLMEHGANLQIGNNKGVTPLHLCNTADQVVMVLRQGVRTNVQTHDGKWSPLMTQCSAERGNERIVELIASAPGTDLDLRRDSGQTALHMAAGNNHVEIVRMLVKLGARSKTADTKGDTPLITAVSKGHFEIVEELLPVSDVAHSNKAGDSALSIAVRRGLKKLVRMMVGSGAKVTAEDVRLAKGTGDMEAFLKFAKNSDLASAMRQIGLTRYLPNLYDHELDRLSDCSSLRPEDLTRMGVTNEEHRYAICAKVSKIKPTRPTGVSEPAKGEGKGMVRRASRRVSQRLAQAFSFQ